MAGKLTNLGFYKNNKINSYQNRVLCIDLKKSSEDTREKSSLESSLKTSDKIINLIKNNPNITIFMISKEIKLTERAIKKNIFKLKEKGILKRIGPDKGGYWEVIEK